MSIKITWVLEARLDLEYYVEWYPKQAGKTIARGLITSIQEAELLIKNNPRIAKRVAEEDELREFIIQKYPFLISYWIKDEQAIKEICQNYCIQYALEDIDFIEKDTMYDVNLDCYTLLVIKYGEIL